jgi:phospholipid transport system substrate-binding protein
MSKYRIGAAVRAATIGFVLAAFLTGGSAPNPLPEKDAGKFVLGVVYSGMALFSDPRMDPAERDTRFSRLVGENLDTPRIARFVLGRHWDTASESEREAFMRVYPSYLARIFETRIGQFGGSMVSVSTVKAIDGETRVTTVFEFLGPRPTATSVSEMEISWLVRPTPDGFKIEDIDYQGVSLKLQQRSDVTGLVAQVGETVEGLVRYILDSLNVPAL